MSTQAWVREGNAMVGSFEGNVTNKVDAHTKHMASQDTKADHSSTQPNDTEHAASKTTRLCWYTETRTKIQVHRRLKKKERVKRSTPTQRHTYTQDLMRTDEDSVLSTIPCISV